VLDVVRTLVLARLFRCLFVYNFMQNDVDLTLVNMTVNQQRDLVVGWFWTMFLLCMFTFMIAIPVNVVVEQ
jgi:hypothetical protein